MTHLRFTPTRVGTTNECRVSISSATVHPHACGDHVTSLLNGLIDGGSPPRVWGPQIRRHRMRPRHRFTPTRVGTTGVGQHQALLITVHPHACGDHDVTVTSTNRAAGSPPRVWGPRGCLCKRGHGCRFTPTRVGTTRRRDTRN